MKTIGTIILLLFIITGVSSQDTAYIKRKVSESDIKVLYSYYTQNGDHSAVTGGIGTEKLQVYAPAVSLTHKIDSTNTILFDVGIDFITSASTDRIDYNMTSASYNDAHFQLSAGYSRYFPKPGVELGLTGTAAMESDFLSEGFNLWIDHTDKSGMTRYTAAFQAFFDDLRWGRLNPHYKRPVTLVYPVELRDTAWFDIYMRYSFNLSLGIERAINRRMIIGFFPGLTLQTGLLSTPFQRVYFQEQDTARVENLPRQRFKIPLGVKFNAYIGTSLILNTYYRFYVDDFDILSNTLELETFYKVNPYFTPSLSLRLYQQTASKYFLPYKEHILTETFYTSDYDLSAFYSVKAGAGLRFAPYKRMFGNWSFDEIELKYSYYWRSDGLHANFISTYFGIKAANGH